MGANSVSNIGAFTALSVAANWGTTFALLAGQGRDESIAAEADQPHIRSWRARSGALATS